MSKLKNIYVYGLKDKHCAICGKLIIPTPDWAYKMHKGNTIDWYCSYKCYRKAGGDSGKYNGYKKRLK